MLHLNYTWMYSLKQIITVLAAIARKSKKIFVCDILYIFVLNIETLFASLGFSKNANLGSAVYF